jgi:hypothetical protein
VPYSTSAASPQRVEPGLGTVGNLCLLPLLRQLSFDGIQEEAEVVELVFDVREVHTELVLGDVALRVGPYVAILLRLLGCEALRQLGLTCAKFFGVAFAVVVVPEAFEDLAGVVEEAPHVGPHQVLKPRDVHVGVSCGSPLLKALVLPARQT